MKIQLAVKRFLDFILSVIMLLILLPIMVVVALLIKIESNGPIFYMQNRTGKNQKEFSIYKFRTMVQGADQSQKIGVEVKSNDSRITWMGRFLRRFKIDELAQIINILKGEMSFVGPRPTLPEYLDQYEEWELDRFLVSPGLTGLAQVKGNIFLNQKEKSSYDVQYVQKISLLLDTQIIIKTFAVVLFGEEKFLDKSHIKSNRE